METADQLLGIVREIDPSLALKYNKFYIGLAKDGRPDNFVSFRPQKSGLILRVKLKQSDDVQSKIDTAGLDTLSYDRWGNYRLRLTRDDPMKHAGALKELIRIAHDNRSS
jgi:predicted transport protein